MWNYYKIEDDGIVIGYTTLSNPLDIPNYIPITKEEYELNVPQEQEEESIEIDRKTELQLQKAEIDAELAAIEQNEVESGKDEQQLVAEEQANLMTLRPRLEELSSAKAAHIENRLDAISDYWDSKEGQVATYGTK